MECRSADRIRHAKLIVLLRKLAAGSESRIESTAERRAGIVAANSHNGPKQQLTTLLSRYGAVRKRRRAARLVEKVLQTQTHADGRLWLVAPLSLPVRSEPTRVRHEVVG